MHDLPPSTFLALAMSGATFNFFGSLRAALLMGACLYAGARWATAKDPEMLRILFRSSQYRARYDPGRFEPVKSGRIVP